MGHACSLSNLGGRDWENHGSWLAQAKSLQDSISTNENLTVMVHVHHPSYRGSINRSMAVQAGPGINLRPYFKITKSKKAEDMAQVI